MSRTNSTDWAPGNPVTSARLQDFNEDIDNLYSTGSDRLKVYRIATDPAFRVSIGAGTYRVGGAEGQYAGGTLTVSASVTTYIMIDSSGTIQTSTSAWNTQYAKLGVVVSNGSAITSITNWRNDTVGGDFGGNPTGTVLMWVTGTAPGGYLICDGAAVSRTTYAALFSVTGTDYGNGDGSTTFNLPNLKSRVPMGLETAVKVTVSDCDSAWTAGSNVTASNDTGDKKQGTGSVKLAVASGATTNQILGYKAITSMSFAGKTTIGFWIKSDITIAANDLQLRLDDTAAIASPLESLNIPALIANQWTKLYLPLANPHLDTAIISVGLYQVVDKGAFNLWIDDIATGENYEMGATGGEKLHTLSISEMPSHNHPGSFYSANNTSNGVVASGGTYDGRSNAVPDQGGGQGHNNLQPYLTLNFIIKT